MRSQRLLILLVAAWLCAACVGCRKQQATDTGPNGASITLERPGDVTLQRGGTVSVPIKLTREREERPVTIDFDQLPPGVFVVQEDAKMYPDENVKEYQLRAGDSAALVEHHEVTVTASVGELKPKPQMFRITVKKQDEAEE
jgi:hypothetical protein